MDHKFTESRSLGRSKETWDQKTTETQHEKNAIIMHLALMIFVLSILWEFLSKTLLKSFERAGGTGWWMNNGWMNE